MFVIYSALVRIVFTAVDYQKYDQGTYNICVFSHLGFEHETSKQNIHALHLIYLYLYRIKTLKITLILFVL